LQWIPFLPLTYKLLRALKENRKAVYDV